MDGTLWQPTTPAKNSGLKHDIWAPATGVDTMTSEGRVYKGDNGGGTSIAAAITVSESIQDPRLPLCWLMAFEIDFRLGRLLGFWVLTNAKQMISASTCASYIRRMEIPR